MKDTNNGIVVGGDYLAPNSMNMFVSSPKMAELPGALQLLVLSDTVHAFILQMAFIIRAVPMELIIRRIIALHGFN